MNKGISSLLKLVDKAIGHGDWNSAEHELRRVLTLAPNTTQAKRALAMVLIQKTEFQAAGKILRDLIETAPDAVDLNALANVYSEIGSQSLAIETYEQSLVLDEHNVNTLFNLAVAYQSTGRNERATELLSKATGIEPRDAEIWCKLGVSLTHEQCIEQALSAFRRSLEIESKNAEALNGIGIVYMNAGDIATGRRYFEKALSTDPGFPWAIANLVRTRRFSVKDKEEIHSVEAQLAHTAADERVYLHFALGKMYDDIDQYDTAYHHYSIGNAFREKTHSYNPALRSHFIDELIATFTSSFAHYSRCESTLPVFVVGMPRSGSSLIEQIITAHPNAKGVGEFNCFPELIRGLPAKLQTTELYPRCAVDLKQEHLDDLAQSYLSALTTRIGNVTCGVDKMLSNFEHLGLIRSIFPKARIIHCIRNPQDVCLSNYFQLFGPGSLHCSYTWEGLTNYYSEYLRLMAHWHKLGIGALDVVYEELLADPHTQIRKIIAHCGLPWNDVCLNYRSSSNIVHTSSNWQVRQPMYKTSIGRWNNYASFLPEAVKNLVNIEWYNQDSRHKKNPAS